ncbi:hypothetical protein H4R19_003190 [Coemansia spiralis]|nr:hypothetical protein H4R19_003190 [Coemansia spiralis]
MRLVGTGAALAIVLAMALPAVQAHTYVATVTIDGKEQPEGKCIKPWWSNENFPIMDINSRDMMCRTKNMDPSATAFCTVAAGSTVKVLWTESGKGSRAIDPAHPGPCLYYMSPMAADGTGNAWFKIAEEGYDETKKRWCTKRVYDEKGITEVTIPADLKPGDYLLRPELIALHEAERIYGTDKSAGAQYYPNCIQLKITGSGTVVPKGVTTNNIYKKDEPGIHFDLYNNFKTYPLPGPPLYKAGTAPKGGPSPTDIGTPTSTDGDSPAPTNPCNKRKPRKRVIVRRVEM